MEKMTKQQAIEMVNNSFPTIFAKEDVIKLLEAITETESNNQKSFVDVLKKLQKSVIDNIGNLNSDEVVDYDSIQLSISYSREITIDDLSVNYDTIQDAVIDSFDEVVSNYEEEEEETNN